MYIEEIYISMLITVFFITANIWNQLNMYDTMILINFFQFSENNTIAFRPTNEGNSVVCESVNEPGRYRVKWQKPRTETNSS